MSRRTKNRKINNTNELVVFFQCFLMFRDYRPVSTIILLLSSPSNSVLSYIQYSVQIFTRTIIIILPVNIFTITFVTLFSVYYKHFVIMAVALSRIRVYFKIIKMPLYTLTHTDIQGVLKLARSCQQFCSSFRYLTIFTRNNFVLSSGQCS